jgi:GT2 family glycosyltransferase
MISVLITDYKQPVLTKICIISLNHTGFKDKEIIVRDNTNDNIGLAASSNLLAKWASGEYLFFLNNDTIVRADIFEQLLKSPYDITACREFDYFGQKETKSQNALDKFGCPAGEGKIFYPNGAIFIKRKVFEEIGGFDEKLFYYGEDRHLCWRALLAGYSVGYCPGAVFYHASNSLGLTNYARRYLSERNIIRVMLKNYTLGSLFKIIPQYTFWSILELGLVFLTNPKAIIKCYLPAYLWNLKNLPDTIRQRKKVIRRIKDKDLPFSKRIGKLHVLLTQGVPKWQK